MKKMQRIICFIMLLAILLGLVAFGITSCIDGGQGQDYDDEYIILDDEFLDESFEEEESHEGHDHE